MSDGPRESFLGRAWVLGTVFVLFLAPIWAMLAASILQVFPEVVGYEVVWEDMQERRVFTTRSWLIGGTLAFMVEGAFVMVLGVIGGGTLVAKVFGRIKDRSDLRRYAGLAGDVVVKGVELKTSTVLVGEEVAPEPMEEEDVEPAQPEALV